MHDIEFQNYMSAIDQVKEDSGSEVSEDEFSCDQEAWHMKHEKNILDIHAHLNEFNTWNISYSDFVDFLWVFLGDQYVDEDIFIENEDIEHVYRSLRYCLGMKNIKLLNNHNYRQRFYALFNQF